MPRTVRPAYSYRGDPGVPKFPDDRPIVIFDGYCALCSASAQFILRNDRKGIYRLLPAQSPLGHALYRHYDLDPANYETNILIADGVAWFKSEGNLRIAEGLGFPWSLAVILRAVPLRLRDRLYECVARNRLRWFGARTTCFMPDPRYRDRFLA